MSKTQALLKLVDKMAGLTKKIDLNKKTTAFLYQSLKEIEEKLINVEKKISKRQVEFKKET